MISGWCLSAESKSARTNVNERHKAKLMSFEEKKNIYLGSLETSKPVVLVVGVGQRKKLTLRDRKEVGEI